MADHLSVKDVSSILELSPTTVRRLADAGELGPVMRTPGGRGAGHRRFDAEAVEAYRKSRVDPPTSSVPALGIQFT